MYEWVFALKKRSDGHSSTRWLAIDYFNLLFAYSILPFWSVWLQGEGIDAEMIGVLLVGASSPFPGAMFINASLVKEPLETYYCSTLTRRIFHSIFLSVLLWVLTGMAVVCNDWV